MKNSTGFFSGLFGKKAISKKPASSVPFHVIGPDGSETQHLQIGRDIPEEQYQNLRDPKDGALYGLTVYQNGVPSTTVISKQIWEQAKAQFSEIDRVGNEFTEKTIDKLKDL